MYKYISMINEDVYWKKYNFKRNNLIKTIVKHNAEHNFNYFEKNNYNHVRDLFALTLAQLNSNKKKIYNILDYGSNLLTISNLINKIDTNNFFFSIYDPFNDNFFKKIFLKKINYEIFNKENQFIKKKFDLINFGSTIQYQENFFKNLQSLNLIKTKFIIITSTPISLERTYFCKQSNHTNLTQKIYSYNSIIKNFKKKNFKLIFKSVNDNKYIGCKKNRYKTLSLNLIFLNE